MEYLCFGVSNIVFALCMCLLNERAIHKTCGYKQEIDQAFIKPLIAAVIMGIVTYMVHLILDILIGGRFVPTIISIVIAMIVYAVSVLKLGVLSRSDIKALPQGHRIYNICQKVHLLPRE